MVVAPKQKEIARRKALELKERATKAADSTASDQAARKTTIDSTRTTEERQRSGLIQRSVTEGADLFSDTLGTAREFEIHIVTERMKIALSNRGGEVRSVKLLDFAKSDGEPVELVPEGARGGLGLSFFVGGAWQSLSRVPFNVEIDGIPANDERTVYLGGGRDRVTITFSRKIPGGGEVGKVFTFKRDGYDFDLDIRMKREGALVGSKEYAILWDCGLAVTEKNKKYDLRQFAALGMIGNEYYQKLLRKFGKTRKVREEGTVVWAGARTKYFLSAVITDPRERRSGSLLLEGDKDRDFVGYGIEYPFRGDPRVVDDRFTCYTGPLDMKTLKAYGVGLDRTIDLGWIRFFSIWILKLMLLLKRFIPNYGVIIIILSLLTKVLFYRLTHKSFKSMKDMQRLQPKINELKEKYKDDKEKINQEMMKLYKEAGVNPLGGCLPLILQMPVFIALYNVLRNTIELRGAHFVSWISDLSSPDTLFSFSTSIPFIGKEFHLLPILMGGAMLLQSKLGASPTGDAASAGQTKMMTYSMPIIFTIFFYSMPSGLVLYWLINNVVTIIQQYYIHKEIEEEERAKAAQETEGAGVVGVEIKEASDDDGGNGKSVGKKKSHQSQKSRSKSKRGKRFH